MKELPKNAYIKGLLRSKSPSSSPKYDKYLNHNCSLQNIKLLSPPKNFSILSNQEIRAQIELASIDAKLFKLQNKTRAKSDYSRNKRNITNARDISQEKKPALPKYKKPKSNPQSHSYRRFLNNTSPIKDVDEIKINLSNYQEGNKKQLTKIVLKAKETFQEYKIIASLKLLLNQEKKEKEEEINKRIHLEVLSVV